MKDPTLTPEGRGQTIIAYVLLGVLLALYPALLGYRAIVNYIGPEVVEVDGCNYVVTPLNSYSSIKTIEPKDDAAKSCIKNNQDLHDHEVINNLPYKDLVRELRNRQRPNQ